MNSIYKNTLDVVRSWTQEKAISHKIFVPNSCKNLPRSCNNLIKILKDVETRFYQDFEFNLMQSQYYKIM